MISFQLNRYFSHFEAILKLFLYDVYLEEDLLLQFPKMKVREIILRCVRTVRLPSKASNKISPDLQLVPILSPRRARWSWTSSTSGHRRSSICAFGTAAFWWALGPKFHPSKPWAVCCRTFASRIPVARSSPPAAQPPPWTTTCRPSSSAEGKTHAPGRIDSSIFKRAITIFKKKFQLQKMFTVIPESPKCLYAENHWSRHGDRDRERLSGFRCSTAALSKN